jgi:hypothetical protein
VLALPSVIGPSPCFVQRLPRRASSSHRGLPAFRSCRATYLEHSTVVPVGKHVGLQGFGMSATSTTIRA